uniref:Voltage-dependent calcium channel gamma-7 subunit-like isoform X1 n=2 Tax=Crassostrea virginica TaxID=6565 RepID=A0A8B8CTW9_CRAVI|nr:voltage-dependent calcium channel gamma-7 subunit-like isoform X1 [Crassostrea virginica]
MVLSNGYGQQAVALTMRCSTHTITKVSLFFGATAISTMALAIATNNWIIAAETTKPFYSTDMTPNDTGLLHILNAYRVNITTNFGLWQFCTSYVPFSLIAGFDNFTSAPPVDCRSLMDYTPSPNEDTSNQETTFKIVESQRNTAPFFVVNMLLMLLAAVFHVVGVVRGSAQTLIGGIIYIVAGLCTAVSIVLYITYVNDGVHYADPEKEDNHFEYRYGWSAYVLTLSYLSSQVAAVLCVTLFLQRYPRLDDLVRLIPGLDKKVPKTDTAQEGTLI